MIPYDYPLVSAELLPVGTQRKTGGAKPGIYMVSIQPGKGDDKVKYWKLIKEDNENVGIDDSSGFNLSSHSGNIRSSGFKERVVEATGKQGEGL